MVLIFTPRKHKTGSESAEFIIERGQSLGAVAQSLAERDIIISRYLFVAYAVLSGHEKDFKAGRYRITQPSIVGLVSMFSQGLSEPEDIIVIIPEGLNVADIDKILAKTGLIRLGEFLSATLPYEGYLFPDTYRFAQNQNLKIKNQNDKIKEVQPQESPEVEPLDFQSVQEIIEKMRENFETKIMSVDNLSELNSDRLRRVIIIASMLEKEVKSEQDMRLVAGIIEKRLQLNMPLEIDAAVAYGACRPKFLLGEYCDVSLANIVDNILVDSAYNTYKRKGLPVGPISNPGLKAISAVLNPQPSDYLYYLSAKDGATIFSETAVEHIRARQKYLK